MSHLADKTERHPLIVRVVHHVLALPLSRALALVGRRDVEAGVHPAVGLEGPLTHPATRQVALYGLTEELIAGDCDGAEDQERAAPSVVQPEDPVVDGGFLVSYQELGRGGGGCEDSSGHH